MKALSIGRLVYDINILLDTFPVEGSKNTTKEMISCSGGSANTIAYSLAKWNLDSFISGVIGYDEIGTTMKKNMEENKIRTNFLETNYDIKTLTSYIFINKENNSRTVVETDISDFSIKKYEYDTDIDCIITDGHEYNASVYAFNKYNNALTILNAYEPSKGILDLFKYAKYVVCSSEVAENLTGLQMDFNTPITISNIYKKIVDKYPHIHLLITVEGKGTVYAINNEIKVLRTINTETLDKTGIRDIFVAMIGYGLTNGYDLETTIRLATIAESLSKNKIGSSLKIPILSDIVKYYEERFGTLNLKEARVDNNSYFETAPKEKPNQNQIENNNVVSSANSVLEKNTVNDEQIVSQVFSSNPTIMDSSNDITHP